jgi:hypothetical protein
MLGSFAVLGLSGPLGPFLLFVIFLIFIFEVVMFINAIRNKNISSTAKVLWIIGMLIFHPFVAIAYFFTDYKNN